MKQLQVKWRGGFSVIYNLIDINKTIQTIEFDTETRNAFFNLIVHITDSIKYSSTHSDNFIEFIYTQLFNKKISEIPYSGSSSHKYDLYDAKSDFEYVFDNNSYHEILTFIEATCIYFDKKHNIYYYDDFNKLFEKHCVGYRFINDTLSPITDKIEIEEIEKACNISSKFQNASSHIQKALDLLSDRENKDYKSSVHESISAIEATVNIIMASKKTLGEALKELDKQGYSIHPALKSAFEKMYGYTSDKDGIRHDFGNDSNVDFEEAKYMLVSCSAFMNYLIGISSKIH